jgi:glucose uptake protein GlcU
MDLLVTLLIYLLIFVIIGYLVQVILAGFGATPQQQMAGKGIVAFIFLIFLLALLFDAPLPRLHWKN